MEQLHRSVPHSNEGSVVEKRGIITPASVSYQAEVDGSARMVPAEWDRIIAGQWASARRLFARFAADDSTIQGDEQS